MKNVIDTKVDEVIDFSKKIKQLSLELNGLAECVELYKYHISDIRNYDTDNEIEIFGLNLILNPETVKIIKNIVIEDLRSTQVDWLNEIEDLKNKLKKY